MSTRADAGKSRREGLFERRTRRPASGRLVVLSIHATLLAVAVVGAVVTRMTARVTTALIQREQREAG